jgi:DHA1 family multidrug resistance protein-like MFS transporter
MAAPAAASPRVPKLLYTAVALEAMGYGAIFALLADLQDKYDLPTWSLGLIAGTSFLAALVSQVSLARYADRGHTVLLLRVGLGVAAAGMLWFGIATQLWGFVGARLLLGLGSGMFIPAARRVAVSRSGPNSGEVLGRMASVEVGGFVIGPLIAAVLSEAFGLHVPFIAMAVALALTSPAVARIQEPPVHEEQPREALRVLARIRGVRSGLAIALALYLSIGVFETIWAVYLSDLGASTGLIAITLAVFALPLVALSPFGGRLADRRGPMRTGVLALACSVPLIAMYGVVGSVAAAAAIALAHCVCDSVTTPSGQAAVARSSPRSLVAAGQGLYGAAGTAAAAVAAFGAAPLYDASGDGRWFGTAAGVGLLTTLAWGWGRGTPAAEPAQADEPEAQPLPG